MTVVESIAVGVLVLSVLTGLVGGVGVMVVLGRGTGSGRKARAMRPWAIAAGASGVAFVISAVIGAIAARPRLTREREANYATATTLLSQGNARDAIPFLVKVGSDLDDRPGAGRDAPKELAEARGKLQTEVLEKLNRAAEAVDLQPQSAKRDVAAAMLGVDEVLLGDRYRKLEDRAREITARADARLTALSVAPESSAHAAIPATGIPAANPANMDSSSVRPPDTRDASASDDLDGSEGARTEWRVGDREEAAAVLRELIVLEAEGREMESLRRSKELAVIRQCGTLMRRRQPTADALRERAAKLPLDVRLFLEAAAMGLNPCVSCLDNALADCNAAHHEIENARELLRQHR